MEAKQAEELAARRDLERKLAAERKAERRRQEEEAALEREVRDTIPEGDSFIAPSIEWMYGVEDCAGLTPGRAGALDGGFQDHRT
jgi:transposase